MDLYHKSTQSHVTDMRHASNLQASQAQGDNTKRATHGALAVPWGCREQGALHRKASQLRSSFLPHS